MDYRKKFKQWVDFCDMDEELSQELNQISCSEEAIANHFAGELAFGTGGIRGKMGAGTLRMNIYIVRKVTAGLAHYLISTQRSPISVAIAFDTRHNSDRFAQETASVLAYYGIKAILFSEPTPTPLLSFAVRHLGASGGVVITASHNPPADNGYKVYGSDGGQITDEMASAITGQILQVENELTVPAMDMEEAKKRDLIKWVPKDVAERYFVHLGELSFSSNWHTGGPLPVRVVYTPLHGTGARFIPKALKNAGITDLFPVPEQMKTDPSCPTVKHPNPEDWDVFELAIALAETKEADLIMATDLDADRLGAVVRDFKQGYVPLTGNQMGCLILDYILSQRKQRGDLPDNGLMVQTVVTSQMGKVIAEAYGVEVVETLTGFKYIGEQIKERVDSGRNVFLFGYEESYGYLAGDFVRDKDGIQASQLVAEITAFYKNQGMTLLDALEQLYRIHGYFQEALINRDLAENDLTRVDQVMSCLRSIELSQMTDPRIIQVNDYLNRISYNLITGEYTPIDLPSSNSLKYTLEGNAWFCVRPSGTEPKIKIYLGIREENRRKADEKIVSLKESILRLKGLFHE